MRLEDLHQAVKLNESTISLLDIYDHDELGDESEQLYHWVTEDDYEKQFQVKTMNADEASKLKTPRNDMTVIDAYKQFAASSQKSLVKQKMARYDHNRIVVIAGETVVDGNHQVVAAILSNNPLKYINVYD